MALTSRFHTRVLPHAYDHIHRTQPSPHRTPHPRSCQETGLLSIFGSTPIMTFFWTFRYMFRKPSTCEHRQTQTHSYSSNAHKHVSRRANYSSRGACIRDSRRGASSFRCEAWQPLTCSCVCTPSLLAGCADIPQPGGDAVRRVQYVEKS